MRRIKIPVGVKIFIAIWLLALCVPTVRDIPRSLLLYQQYPTINQQLISDLARQFPANATLAGWKAELAIYFPNGANRDRKNVRAVLTRFPDDLASRALWVRISSSLFSSVEAARKSKDQVKLAAWKDAAQVAREGAKAEPENAFWPWMEAGFEFGLSNDKAGYAAFARMTNCSRFNDYFAQTNKARYDFLVHHSNVSWEQKVITSNLAFYYHYTVLLDASKFATNRAVELKRAGKAGDAIALEDALLNGARLRRLDSDNVLGGLISEDIARQALEKFLKIPKPREPGQTANGNWLWVDPAIHGKDLARGWAAYVEKNGQPQLVANGAFVSEASVSQEFNNSPGVYGDTQFGMTPPWGAVAVVGPLVLLALASTIFVGAAFWLLTSPVRWKGAAPSRGQVVSCANFSFWLLLGICAIGLVNFSIFLNPFISFSGSEMVPTWIALNWLMLSLLCWLLPTWFVTWKRGRGWSRTSPEHPRALPLFWNRVRKIAWGAGVVGVILVYSNGYGLWDDTPFQSPIALSAMILGLALALSLELARWNLAGTRIFYRKSSEPVTSVSKARWIIALLWLVTFAGLGFLLRGFVLGDIFFDQFFVALFTVLALAGTLYFSWKTSPNHFRLQLAHRTLGVLIVAWSVAFFCGSIGLMPLRAQLNRNLDRKIKIGEIAWMREQIAKTK